MNKSEGRSDTDSLSYIRNYDFVDCRKGITLEGTGVVTKQVTPDYCKITLTDFGKDPKRPDRAISCLVNQCTNVGDGRVTIITAGKSQTHTMHDSNYRDSVWPCQ